MADTAPRNVMLRHSSAAAGSENAAAIRAEGVGVDFPVASARAQSIKNVAMAQMHRIGGRVFDRGARVRIVRALDGISFTLAQGDRLGLVGPNGAGKTTLFRMIVGQEKPDAGVLRVGDSVKPAYVDQSRDALDPKRTVWEAISGGSDTITLGGRTVQSRSYVASFNFRGTDQQKRVSELSGGERNRLHLATMLKSGANLLLLDEPTNDLDVDTLRALEDALLDFAGCAVVISHDRWFLDRIATHILAFEDEGRAVWSEGNYADYEADRRKRLGAEAERPHRLRFKRLPRG